MSAYGAALARLSVEDRARTITFVQFLNGIEGRCRGGPRCKDPSTEYPSRTEKLAALIMEVRDEERARWARMLREEADAVACTSTDWTVEEVAQELRDMADKIERGGVG